MIPASPGLGGGKTIGRSGRSTAAFLIEPSTVTISSVLSRTSVLGILLERRLHPRSLICQGRVARSGDPGRFVWWILEAGPVSRWSTGRLVRLVGSSEVSFQTLPPPSLPFGPPKQQTVLPNKGGPPAPSFVLATCRLQTARLMFLYSTRLSWWQGSLYFTLFNSDNNSSSDVRSGVRLERQWLASPCGGRGHRDASIVADLWVGGTDVRVERGGHEWQGHLAGGGRRRG